MGVKVTFLREADDNATPVAQAVTLVPKSAVRTRERPDNTSSSCAGRPWNVAPSKPAARTATVGGRGWLAHRDRVVVSPPRSSPMAWRRACEVVRAGRESRGAHVR